MFGCLADPSLCQVELLLSPSCSWLTSEPLLKVSLLAPVTIVHTETQTVKALRANQKNAKCLQGEISEGRQS